MIKIHNHGRFWIFALSVNLLLGESVFSVVSTENVIERVLQVSVPI